MQPDEKELNAILFDQLTIIERLERAYKNGIFENEIIILKNEVKRKLCSITQ